MSAFFLTIYRFFSKHRIIFYIFLLSFITSILLFATQIRFEEDILKSLPSDKQADPILLCDQQSENNRQTDHYALINRFTP